MIDKGVGEGAGTGPTTPPLEDLVRRGVRTAAMVLTASVMTGILTGCDSARASVSRVVDGDTVDVVVEGREQRVRLLNIDTPETVDPDKDVQCLGPEATAHLATLLPVGTAIELLTDDEKVDRDGRLLAGVRLDDGRLVNAEMARAGLALPMVVGSNDRFLPEVEQANAEAVTAQRGLYDPAISCTVPGQVRETEGAAAALAAPTASTSAEQADAGVAGAAALLATAVALRSALKAATPGDGLIWKAVHALPDRSGMEERIGSVVSTAQDRELAHRTKARELRTPPPPPPTINRPGTTTRTPKPEPSTRGEAATTGRRSSGSAGAPAPVPAPEAKPKPNSEVDTSGGSGPAGYTGPRCYAPGGKTWTPC